MSDTPKWEPGAVKLVDGSDAIIHHVQFSSNTMRYIGMRRGKLLDCYVWIPTAWTLHGYEYVPHPDIVLLPNNATKLVPPAKKTMRIKGGLYVYEDKTVVFAYDDEEAQPPRANRFACIAIDQFVKEGEGL